MYIQNSSEPQENRGTFVALHEGQESMKLKFIKKSCRESSSNLGITYLKIPQMKTLNSLYK